MDSLIKNTIEAWNGIWKNNMGMVIYFAISITLILGFLLAIRIIYN